MSKYKAASAPTHHTAELDDKFPILCENCLGPSPYVRMTRQELGAQCHICERPFTEFAWCPGRGSRRKRTEICQACAKSKHVCQTCVLDLYYQVPVEARDRILGNIDKTPQSGANLEYHLQQIQQGQSSQLTNPYADKITPEAHNLLIQMKRSHEPYYQRNLPKICSFWVKGECKRGEECPFRHVKPKDPDDPLSNQNIKDRYFGQKDPVAHKLLEKLGSNKALQPPEDLSITTIFLSCLPAQIKKQDIVDKLYKFGEIRSTRLVTNKSVAFVEFVARADAEKAVASLYNNFVMHDKPVHVNWSKGVAEEETPEMSNINPSAQNLQMPAPMAFPIPTPGLVLSQPISSSYGAPAVHYSAPPSKITKKDNVSHPAPVYYPSQNPNQLGS